MLTRSPCASQVSTTILKQCACFIHKRHRVISFEREARVIHKRDIGQHSTDPVSSVRLRGRFDACSGLGRRTPERLRRVVHDLRPDAFLFASCSYFAQHLFVHQVECNACWRAPLSVASFRSHNRVVIALHLICAHEPGGMAVCMSLTRSPSCKLAPVRRQ